MDFSQYDEFGNYIGPELSDEESDYEEENQQIEQPNVTEEKDQSEEEEEGEEEKDENDMETDVPGEGLDGMQLIKVDGMNLSNFFFFF